MGDTADKSKRSAASYCWPPILAIVPVFLGQALGATSPETFRSTHGYYEIAAAVGLMAAFSYTLRLWPHRSDPRLRVPFHLNLAFILFPVIGGGLSFLLSFAR